jgi:uncharacterized protein YcfL
MNKSFLVLITIVILVGCESSVLDSYDSNPPEIMYSLPVDSYVKLILENSFNTIVFTLVDTQQSAGVHSVTVNTVGLTEGFYFYTLTARGVNDNTFFEATRRMILIKK